MAAAFPGAADCGHGAHSAPAAARALPAQRGHGLRYVLPGDLSVRLRPAGRHQCRAWASGQVALALQRAVHHHRRQPEPPRAARHHVHLRVQPGHASLEGDRRRVRHHRGPAGQCVGLRLQERRNAQCPPGRQPAPADRLPESAAARRPCGEGRPTHDARLLGHSQGLRLRRRGPAVRPLRH